MSEERPQEKRRIEPQPMRFFSRREFLEIAATGVAGAALAAGAGRLGASPSRKLTAEELAQWKRELLAPAPRLVYTAARNPQAAVPMGGIGCGNVYIGVGGHLKDWLIFNNLSPIQVPDTFFAVRMEARGAPAVARVLQTPVEGYHVVGQFGGSFQTGTKRAEAPTRHVKGVRLVGEYPFASLEYEDEGLPGKVSLEAFSPFVPMDARLSAYPAVVLLFRVQNPTADPLTVSLAGTLHNAAGGGRAGGNVNRVLRAGSACSGFSAGILPGRQSTLGAPLAVLTNQRAFSPASLEKPEKLTVAHTAGPSPGAAELAPQQPSEGRRVIWLEEPSGLDAEGARALRSAVEDGALLLLSGRAPQLLNDWAATREQPESARRRPDIIFEDFESGTYAGWTVTGTAFGKGPQRGTLPSQQTVSGWKGTYLINSYLEGDGPTGRMVSRPFRIERRFIKFLIGGGNAPGRECVNLVVDGKVVRTATGRDEERLRPALWDVSDLEGREGRLEVVDAESGGWGHINLDDIVFSDTPGQTLPPEVMEALDALMPVRFRSWQWPAQPEPVAWPVSGKLPGFGKDPLRLAGAAAVARVEPAPGAEALAQGVFRREVGKGATVAVFGPLMAPGYSDPILNGRQTLALVAALAGVPHTPAEGADPQARDFGELALVTLGPSPTVETAWNDPEALWQGFSETGRFTPLSRAKDSRPTEAGDAIKGAVATTATVPPGGEVTLPFLLTWRFPNYYFGGQRIGNRYADFWPDAASVARELADRLRPLPSASERRARRRSSSGEANLLELTQRFRDTLYDSTLPYWLLDCLSSQTSTLRSEVCLWSADGTFAGYEGSDGCCPMNCSHVWGYEQTISRLFPDLERVMRQADLMHQQREDGGINNRIALPLQPKPTGERPFADGHASGVLKAYREHLNSRDDLWLRTKWPRIRRAVEYLIQSLDENADGIIEGEQWNTYDCAVYGPNSFIGTYYLAALRAGEEMARLMKEGSLADRWRGIFESGQKRLVDLCWNGEYFVQVFPGYEQRATQYGPGCLADQVIGQWWAHQLGLGYVVPPEMARRALQSVFRYNWLPDLSDFRHNQRVFADGHDKGLLCCTWPKGGRPPRPILYCDEVWTGVEYQVAAHMVYEGLIEEALAIVRGARERYDGQKRNPWNELECGGHYARAMASWSLLLALSGFQYDGPQQHLAFAPAITPEDFRAFFSTAESWGTFSQQRKPRSQTNALAVKWGSVDLSSLRLKLPAGTRQAPRARVQVGRKRIPAEVAAQEDFVLLTFKGDYGAPAGLHLTEGQTLSVSLDLA